MSAPATPVPTTRRQGKLALTLRPDAIMVLRAEVIQNQNLYDCKYCICYCNNKLNSSASYKEMVRHRGAARLAHLVLLQRTVWAICRQGPE